MPVKRLSYRRSIFWLLVMAAMVLSCAGCGKEETGPEEKQSQAGAVRVSAYKDVAGTTWEETFKTETSFRIEDKEEKELIVNIDARIDVPKVEEMSVAEVKEFTLDSENKKAVAEGIFGSEVYAFDTEKLPKDVLDARIEKAEKNLERCQNDAKELEIIEDDPDEEEILTNLKVAKEELERLQRLTPGSGEDFAPVSDNDYQQDDFVGKRDGIEYLLSFDYEEYKAEEDTEWSIRMKARREEDVYPEGLKDKNLAVECYKGDSLSEKEKDDKYDQARKAAEDFLTQVGFSDTVCEQSSWLRWESQPIQPKKGRQGVFDVQKTGYRLCYVTGVDGVAFAAEDTGYMNCQMEADYPSSYPMSTEIILDVVGDKVTYAEWYAPIITTSVTRNVELLPFSDIQEIVRKSISSCISREWNHEESERVETWIDQMRLRYFRLKDKEKKGFYSYVPVWQVMNGYECTCLINAIDGTVIDVGEQLSGNE